MAKKIAETPLMQQYMAMKKKHPDAVLLFRVGDFYETFSEDAIVASEILGITLTRRANGAAQHVELAGFPHHALDTYLPRLVRAGKRVAICEQLEDPKLAKKLVKRGITELVTPGVNTSDGTLDAKTNNFLAGVHFVTDRSGNIKTTGLAYLDITTGEFYCTEGDPDSIDKLLGVIGPKELLRMKGTRPLSEQTLSIKCPVFELDDWVYTSDAARRRLLRQFDTATLKGFGVDDLDAAVIAAGSLLHYLDLTSHTDIAHITTLSRVDNSRFMRLDSFTMRNLEIIAPLGEGGMSLLDVIDQTLTPMGARKLSRWVKFPLIDPAHISRRQDGVEAFVSDPALSGETTPLLASIGDMGRLTSKVAYRRAQPRELLGLRDYLLSAMKIRRMLQESASPVLKEIAGSMPDCAEIIRRISVTLHPEASQPGRGPVIAAGVSEELDRLRSVSLHTREMLDDLRDRESAATGIPSLKVAYNNVFGYYIEVRNTHRDKVPDTWMRKQTLTQAERYITPELKELEEQIRTAADRISEIESSLYTSLLEDLISKVVTLHAAGEAVARADCLHALADVAVEYGYTRPEVDDSLSLDITDGRHPVIERRLPPGEPYVANSVSLDPATDQVMMITGPNMSGKSALLRQTALIALLAHTGSFVPASKARIGVIDKIFTRVGASDNISSGESTFMVEMNEAASILNNMSERSLILFDELGRGTSTYDGISIAWAIVEHIHENRRCHPKTLFATHYHELNEMEKSFGRIHNFNVSVRETGGKVVFMRRLEPGGSEHSFGIHVARLAGMPPSIVKRASEVLRRLEASAGEVAPRDTLRDTATEAMQLSFFQLEDPLLSDVREALLDIDIDTLTPLEALTKLHDLQGLLRGK
ncbi:MAG: DNA mismatch repair protein MutS [Muribaculaceae bacterium]|nr:DNA mismatch repair protein MutS [Muribaculaceae bacterium]